MTPDDFAHDHATGHKVCDACGALVSAIRVLDHIDWHVHILRDET